MRRGGRIWKSRSLRRCKSAIWLISLIPSGIFHFINLYVYFNDTEGGRGILFLKANFDAIHWWSISDRAGWNLLGPKKTCPVLERLNIVCGSMLVNGQLVNLIKLWKGLGWWVGLVEGWGWWRTPCMSEYSGLASISSVASGPRISISICLICAGFTEYLANMYVSKHLGCQGKGLQVKLFILEIAKCY